MSDPNFKLQYGNITVATRKAITFEDVTSLAKEAGIIGIPPNAVINNIQIRQSYQGSTTESEITINWIAPQ